jgi:transposase-like protein
MRRTRTHYTREEKARLLAEYHGGGSRPAEFAADRGIRLATFRTWLSRHPTPSTSSLVQSSNSRVPAKRNGRVPVMKFVTVDTSMGRGAEIEIRVGEVMIRLSSSAGPGFVAELVSGLARSRC